MSWPRWARDDVREFLVACSGPDWPGRPAQAQRLLGKLPEEELARTVGGRAPAPRAGGVDKSALPFAYRAPPDKRARRRERNREVMSPLRRLVLGRARGRCEFRCAVAGEPVEAHHIFGGADRIEKESEFTLAGICETCHDRCDASPAWAREQGLAFARRMAAAAQVAADAAAVAGFTATVELLEARLELAAAQARPLPRSAP